MNFRHICHLEYKASQKPILEYLHKKGSYNYDGKLYPRISDVLNILNRKQLDSWRERIGNNAADLKSQMGIKRGNDFHQICEAYLKNECTCQYQNKLLAMSMFESSKSALDRIDNIRGIELPVFSTSLKVGGTLDIVAEFDGVNSIIDLKTSSIPKKYEWCKSFFLQEAFYAVAYEEMTSKPIEQLVTILISEDGTLQVLKENRDDWIFQLNDLVQNYYQINGVKHG